MKNLFNLFALVAVLAIGVSSCSDPCKDKACGNGDCDEGTCVCNDNYLTDSDGNCTVMRNTLFVGTYDVQMTCNAGGSSTSTATVVTGNTADGIIIEDFNNVTGNDIVATISMTDDLSIPQQTTLASLAYSGSGSRSNSVFSFTLNTATDTCQVTMTKQ